MTKIPFAHQIEGTAYLMAKGGGFLYMEPRTGKTKTYADFIMNSNFSKILIVTLPTIMDVWAEEFIDQGVPRDQINVISGTKTKRLEKLTLDLPFNICNYHMLSSYKVFEAQPWEAICFDESSKIANGTTKVTQYTLRAIRKLRTFQDMAHSYLSVTCLSGNPAPESPMQYAAQAIVTEGSFFGETSLPNYIFKYWEQNLKTYKWQPKDAKHLTDIQAGIKCSCFVRTMKQIGLGSRILYSRRYIMRNKAQAKAINWALKRKAVLNKQEATMGDKVFIGYMNQIGAGINPENGEMINKEKIIHILKHYEETPEPLIVCSFFKEPLRVAHRLFADIGIKCRLLTGETSEKATQGHIKDFQDGKFDILLGQSEKIMMGIDLSRANTMFTICNSFKNEVREQLVKRHTNVNKKEAVEVIDLITRRTMDENLVQMLINKDLISRDTLIGGIEE